MKKLLLVALAILFCVGVARAAEIPTGVDPKNYPEVWTQTVYNGSGATITSGYVVQWDFDTADSTAGDGTDFDDMCPWVKLCDAADDIWTAGATIFGQDIANGDTGRIIIRGPAIITNGGTAPTVNTQVSGSASGTVADETAAAGDKCILGVVIKASAANNDVGGEAYTTHSLIYVNPSYEAN